jgi:iron(III) transport system permease protein
MAILIFAASAAAMLLFMTLAWWIARRTQAWRGTAR